MKFTSRKWIICCAIILGGVASVISGICTDNTALTIIGGVCATISAVLYEICETCIDCAAVGADETITVTEETGEDGDSVG